MNQLSVIIPTYNRKAMLKKALQAYRCQSASHQILEILVVDDGSTDGTEVAVAECQRVSGIPVRYFRQQNKGPAAARNVGIREAKAPILLFTDDDIIPGLDLVFQHLVWHDQHPEPFIAVLGLVTWPREIDPTPFMRWYFQERLVPYRHFAAQNEIKFHFFITGNTSLKTEFLRENGLFDEEFKTSGWEDTELAFRLAKHGLRLLYNPVAVGYHHHVFSFEAACRRTRRVAEMREVFERKEAGACMLEANFTYRPKSWRRVVRSTVTHLIPFLVPLLNSRIPLPSAYYSRFLEYYHTGRSESGEHGQDERTR